MIKITYNCPESEDEMVKTNCGFYCSSCSKEVYDFTEKSADEIAQIRKDNPNISCGVFTTEQAQVDVRTGVQNIFRIAFAAIFIFGLNVTMLFGQEPNVVATSVVSQIEVSDETILITGTLKSLKGNQLEGWINCYYGEEAISADTDVDGNFTLELPREVIGQKITMLFSARGYHMKEVELEVKAAKCYTYQIELKKYKKSNRLFSRRTKGMMM